MRFLVTRPQPDCKRTADRIRAAGQAADEAPLLLFTPSPPETIDLTDVAALAFSSRRAVEALRQHGQLQQLRDLPVFTVGDTTAQACHEAGYQDVRSASGDIAALGRLILSHKDRLGQGIVLYPAAKDRAGDLEDALTNGGVSCKTLVVYKMDAAMRLPEDVEAKLVASQYEGVLVFSRRTAETFLQLLKNSRLDHVLSSLRIYAISHQAAEPLSNHMEVKVAERPCEKALLDLALGEC